MRHMMLCVGSYKWVDDYAKHNGFPNHQAGAAMIAVIDHNAKTLEGFITMTDDLDLGIQILNFRRDNGKRAKPDVGLLPGR